MAPQPLTEYTQQFAESDDDDEETQEPEPSLFDILQDNAKDELDEDLPSDEQAYKGIMGSPGKALAHGRAKCYLDKGASGHSGEASESEVLRVGGSKSKSKSDRGRGSMIIILAE